MSTPRFHIDLATGKIPFPSRYSTYRLSNRIRRLLIEHQREHDSFEDLLATFSAELTPAASRPHLFETEPLTLDEESLYAKIASDYLHHDIEFWKKHPAHLEKVLNYRVELLKVLCTSNTILEELRSRALDQVCHNLDYFSGWLRTLMQGERFQLGEAEP